MSSFDLYQSVTDSIIAKMETSGANWVNPFNKGRNSLKPYNATTGRHYRGINTVLLNFTPFTSNAWASFNQWRNANCAVRKGEKASIVVFFSMLEKKNSATGETDKFPMLKYFNVFNADQVDGDLADKHRAVAVAKPSDVATVAVADAIVARTNATIRHSREPRAYYSGGGDFIHMPERALFDATPTSTATEAYYSTLFHELTHWTSQPTRCARKLGERFGDHAYAFEELVAELGAAFLCAEAGITREPRADHAHYLNNWLSVLKNDKRAIFRAASLAREASEFITGKKTEAVEEAA